MRGISEFEPEAPYQYSKEGPICPHCGHGDGDDRYDDEGEHEYTCGNCGKDYECSIRVSHSYTTKTKGEAK